jgi:aminoglycoside phosphotransferase (APT) family kinase protein
VKETALFTLAANPVLPTKLVLRRDLAKSITGSTVVDEYPLIERAFKLGLPAPQPILLESDPSILDGAFMIMTEITDAVIAGTYFAKERRQAPRNMGPEFGRELATVMAQLHSRTAIRGPHTHLPNHIETVRKLYENWQSMPKSPLSICADLGFAWLFSHPLPPDRPRCLVHGDFSVHNIMARDGHFAALLDWELAREGDPAEDIAECRMLALEDTMPWEDFVKAYVAAGGDPNACEPHAVAYQCVWMLLDHFVMNAKVRNYFASGERDDPLAAAVGSHYHDRLLQYQARAIKLATALIE